MSELFASLWLKLFSDTLIAIGLGNFLFLNLMKVVDEKSNDISPEEYTSVDGRKAIPAIVSIITVLIIERLR